jgi:hypothetical protein
MFTGRNLYLAVLAFAIFGLGAMPLVQAQDKKDATGTWKWSQEGPGGQIDFTLILKQEGQKLTGTITGFNGEESPIEDGKVVDGTISFKVTRDFGGRSLVTHYTGKMEGDTLKAKSETIFALEFDAKRSN